MAALSIRHHAQIVLLIAGVWQQVATCTASTTRTSSPYPLSQYSSSVFDAHENVLSPLLLFLPSVSTYLTRGTLTKFHIYIHIYSVVFACALWKIVDGLCVPRSDVGLQAGFTLPSIFQDCVGEFEECRRFAGIPECTEELPEGSDFDTSTCTCFDLGGEYLDVGGCLDQCGTFITASDPGPESGFPGPGPISVCCRPYRYTY